MLCKCLLPCELMCTVTSPLDWPWKTTPKWPLTCWNLSTGSKDTVKFIFKSAVLYSHSWSDLNIGLAMKNYPKMTPHMSKSHLSDHAYIKIQLPNHTKPNQMSWKMLYEIRYLIWSNFYYWHFLIWVQFLIFFVIISEKKQFLAVLRTKNKKIAIFQNIIWN